MGGGAAGLRKLAVKPFILTRRLVRAFRKSKPLCLAMLCVQGDS